MSDVPEYSKPLVYDDSMEEILDLGGNVYYRQRRSSDSEQQTRALISIANSLAILADETAEISPITHAAFIIGDAMCTADADPKPGPGGLS